MIDPGPDRRVVLVTGANNPHGVGAAAAHAFAAQGASVFVTYLRAANYPARLSEDPAVPGRALYSLQQVALIDPVLEAIQSAGGRTEAWEADLAQPEAITQLCDRVEATLGPVEVLVHNAGHCVADTFERRRYLAR